MRIGLLGALTVEFRERQIELRSATQRRALIFLALHANEVVSSDHLADAVWNERAPANVEHSVHSLIYRLRQQVSTADGLPVPVNRHDPGYILEIDPRQIDANRFTSQVELGRAMVFDQPESALDTLGPALSLWRGEPLLDVAYEPWAAAEIRRLTEIRIGACEAVAEANLTLGRGELVIAELESMTERYPLRESCWVLLWRALAQVGRHLEVTASYRRAVTILAKEYSIEPSERLERVATELSGFVIC